MSERKERLTREVEDNASLPPRVTTDTAVSAVMCALTERLTAGEAHKLLDALPDAVRPLFQACVAHREGHPVMRLDRAQFLARVASHLGVTPAHAEIITAAVFEAVSAELPTKLIDDVAHQLPHDLQRLWRDPLASIAGRDADEVTDDPAHLIIEDIQRRGHLPDGVSPAAAFWAVMCTLADRVSGGEARDLALGLPETLRPVVERCMMVRPEHGEVFDKSEFLKRVADHLGVAPADADAIASAVFGIVKRILPIQEVDDVASQLPPDMREMWRGA